MLLPSLATLTWIGWSWLTLLGLSAIGLILALIFEITAGLKTAGAFGWAMFAWMMLSVMGAFMILFAMLIAKLWGWLH